MPLKVSLLLAIIVFALLCFLCQGFFFPYRYPVVFNFGDSNSDTGGLLCGMGFPVPPPNGQTYFRKPAGRFCDGRLVIDFLVSSWDLPYLNSYLDSIGAVSFETGCNFAVGGSTILPANASSVSPFSFGTQVDQFIRFKARATELLDSYTVDSNVSNLLPQSYDFMQGLYTIDIGENDIVIAVWDKDLIASIQFILSVLEIGIQRLYDEGARHFWIHNVSPVGCLPSIIALHGKNRSKLDKFGCVKAHNKAAKTFNLQLHALCREIQYRLFDIKITYINLFKIKYDLIRNYTQYGFKQRTRVCCGHGDPPMNYDSRIRCGHTVVINGKTVTALACPNPAEYINWDGNHQTEAANLHVSANILNEDYSESLYLR